MKIKYNIQLNLKVYITIESTYDEMTFFFDSYRNKNKNKKKIILK